MPQISYAIIWYTVCILYVTTWKKYGSVAISVSLLISKYYISVSKYTEPYGSFVIKPSNQINSKEHMSYEDMS